MIYTVHHREQSFEITYKLYYCVFSILLTTNNVTRWRTQLQKIAALDVGV